MVFYKHEHIFTTHFISTIYRIIMQLYYASFFIGLELKQSFTVKIKSSIWLILSDFRTVYSPELATSQILIILDKASLPPSRR